MKKYRLNDNITKLMLTFSTTIFKIVFFKSFGSIHRLCAEQCEKLCTAPVIVGNQK